MPHLKTATRTYRWIALALSLVIGPVGLAQAQTTGIEAVGRQLEETGAALEAAVNRGEMTEEAAWAQWYAAKEEILTGAIDRGEITSDELAALQRDVGKAELGEHLEAAGNEIKAAMLAGEMTEQEARDAWEAARSELVSEAVANGTISADDAEAFEAGKEQTELGERLEAAGEKIRIAAEAGELNEEEAWDAWYDARDTLIGEAVETGEISDAEAQAYLTEIHKVELNEKLKAAGERARVGAESGAMTEEEAWASWHNDRDMLIRDAVEAGEISDDVASAYHRELEKIEVGQRLKTAVARGEMTEEEAWARWEETQNEVGQAATADDIERDEADTTANPGEAAEGEDVARQAEVIVVKGEPDDDWARYVRSFIARYGLNEAQQQRAWHSYRAARARAEALFQRLEEVIRQAGDAGAERRVADTRARVERDHARLFEGLKADLERLPTRAQRRAAGPAPVEKP